MTSRFFAFLSGLLPVVALLPLARPNPQTANQVCGSGFTVNDFEPCADYDIEVNLDTESLAACGGCRIHWSARVYKVSSGATISTSSGTDEHPCGAGGVAHSFRSPCDPTVLWRELYLSCGNCP